MKAVSRRTVLRSVAGVAVPLPLLNIMARPRPANAAALSKTGPNGTAKRFVVFYTPNGQGPDFLRCKNDGEGKLVLAPALKPMEKHVDKLLVFNGINNKSAINDRAGIDGGHEKPRLNLTTCVPTVGGKVGGISIDQAIAKEISQGTKLPSIELAVGNTSAGVSSKGPGLYVPTITDPRQAFSKLFTDFKPGDASALERLNAERRSVLDGMKKDYAAFLERMGGDDKKRIDAHFTAIREVEQRLQSTSGSVACKVPAQPPSTGDYVQAGDLMIDLVSLALVCDITRVASITYRGSPTLGGIPKSSHDASHIYGQGGWDLRNRYSAWFAGRFNTMLNTLASADEGGRSVLDNSIIYWCSDHGCGNHNYDMMPIVVAGSGGGYLKTGRHIGFPNGTDGLGFVQVGNTQATGPSQSELYVSFLNAMGIEANSFGKADLCRGPLPGLAA